MNAIQINAWILGYIDGGDFVAHGAAAGPAGTRFVPIFKYKREAVEYRDVRLEMPAMKIKRVTVCFGVKAGRGKK